MTAFENLSLATIIERAKRENTPRKASNGAINCIGDYLTSCGYSQNANPRLFEVLCRLGASFIEKTSKKGLIIKGDCGVGKTFGLLLLAKKFNWGFVTVKEVEGFYKTQPPYTAWENYCRAYDFFENPSTLVIDDLGIEDYPFIYYGQQANPIAELLEIRYRMSFLRDATRTIITTNLTDSEILARYGYRVYDRIDEMFTVIEVKGESQRKHIK